MDARSAARRRPGVDFGNAARFGHIDRSRCAGTDQGATPEFRPDEGRLKQRTIGTTVIEPEIFQDMGGGNLQHRRRKVIREAFFRVSWDNEDGLEIDLKDEPVPPLWEHRVMHPSAQEFLSCPEQHILWLS